MSEVDPVHSCRSAGSRPHRLKKRSRSVPAREHRSLMSDLDRVREGRFLELEEDRRVIAGEGGGKRLRFGWGGAGVGVPAGEEGGLSGFDGATTGFRGEGGVVVLEWKRCEVAGRSGDWECNGMGWRGCRMKWGGLLGVLTWGMTSTLRTVPAAGAPGEPELSSLAGPEAFNLTLAGLDQWGRGGGHGFSFFCCTPAGVGQGPPLGALLSPEADASFTPLIRLVRCSRLSWTSSFFAFVGVWVFLVGLRSVPGLSRGFLTSGARTGCCLDRATWLLTYFALSASSLSTALCLGVPAVAGKRR